MMMLFIQSIIQTFKVIWRPVVDKNSKQALWRLDRSPGTIHGAHWGCTALIAAGRRGGLILDWNNSFIYIIAGPSDCAAGPERLQDSLLVNTSSGWVFRAVWVKDSLNVNRLNYETWNASAIPLYTSFCFLNDHYYQSKRAFFFWTFFKKVTLDANNNAVNISIQPRQNLSNLADFETLDMLHLRCS